MRNEMYKIEKRLTLVELFNCVFNSSLSLPSSSYDSINLSMSWSYSTHSLWNCEFWSVKSTHLAITSSFSWIHFLSPCAFMLASAYIHKNTVELRRNPKFLTQRKSQNKTLHFSRRVEASLTRSSRRKTLSWRRQRASSDAMSLSWSVSDETGRSREWSMISLMYLSVSGGISISGERFRDYAFRLMTATKVFSSFRWQRETEIFSYSKIFELELRTKE